MGYYKNIIDNINKTFSSFDESQKKFINSIKNIEDKKGYIGKIQERTISAKFCFDVHDSFIPEFPIKKEILELMEDNENLKFSLSNSNYIDSLKFNKISGEFEIYEFKFESFSKTGWIREEPNLEESSNNIKKMKIPIFDVIRSICFMKINPSIKKSVFIYLKENVRNKGVINIDCNIEDDLLKISSEKVFNILLNKEDNICGISTKISEIIKEKENEIFNSTKNNVSVFIIENNQNGISSEKIVENLYLTEKIEECLTKLNRIKNNKKNDTKDKFILFSKNIINDCQIMIFILINLITFMRERT